MRFRLRLAGRAYGAEQLPALEALGFRFHQYGEASPVAAHLWFLDEDQESPVWACDSLKALLAFYEAQDCALILDRDAEGYWTLELYNDYRE
jgi:hypothetical protein